MWRPLVDMREVVEIIHEKHELMSKRCNNFVMKVVRKRPYDKLVQELMCGFYVHEDTDINHDVCFDYCLLLEDKHWILKISMLGPYAVLLGIGPDWHAEVITLDTANGMDGNICSIVESYGIALFSQAQLEMPTDIEMEDVEPEDATIYHAVFTDIGPLPWAPWECDVTDGGSTLRKIARFFSAR